MKIYTSSYIDSEELSPDNFVEALERYSDKLEDVVKSYRILATYIKTKKIKIIEAGGYAHGGSFSVDDIDTARLKKEGIVIDFGDKLVSTENPTFYIDTDLDAVLEDAIEKLDKLEVDEESRLSYKNFSKILDEDDDADFDSEDYDLTEEEESALFKFVEDDDTFGIEKIDIELDEVFPEKTTTFNLADKLKIPDSDDPMFVPGNMIIDVHKLDTDKYAFNLAMADLNDHPKQVNYIREKSLFEYNCGECSNIHYETLDSVYTSLKTANAILSNLIEMSKDSRELSTALEFIDSDLRLLQWLLKLDYALDDVEIDEDDED